MKFPQFHANIRCQNAYYDRFPKLEGNSHTWESKAPPYNTYNANLQSFQYESFGRYIAPAIMTW